MSFAGVGPEKPVHPGMQSWTMDAVIGGVVHGMLRPRVMEVYA